MLILSFFPSIAFGASTYKITVQEALANKTYTAYQVFYKDGTNYAIDSSNNPFYEAIVEYNSSAASGKKFEITNKVSSDNIKFVTMQEYFDDSDAASLATIVENKLKLNWTLADAYIKDSKTATSNTVELRPVEDGYYAVKSSLGNKISLVTIFGADVTVVEKNSKDFGTLDFDIARRAVGYGESTDVITKFTFLRDFELTADNLLSITNSYHERITSSPQGMGIILRNLYYNIKNSHIEDIEVYYCANPISSYVHSLTDKLTENVDYTVSEEDSSPEKPHPEFKITFNSISNKTFNSGGIIYIKAVAYADKGLNVLGNNPTESYSGSSLPIDHKCSVSLELVEDSSPFGLLKYDFFRVVATSLIKIIENDTSGNVLNGAKFKLYRDADKTGGAIRFYYTEYSDKVPSYTVTDAELGPSYITDIITVGAADIVGLGDGDYWVEEIEPPFGYNALKSIEKITVAKEVDVTGGTSKKIVSNFNTSLSKDSTTNTFTYDPNKGYDEGNFIANSFGIYITGTGGIGIVVFILVGFLLICTGVTYCVVRRKTKHNNIVLEH